MKLAKGFIVPLLLGIIAILVVGGGIYIYQTKKSQRSLVVQEKNDQNTSVNKTPSPTTPVVNAQNNLKIPSITLVSPNGGETYKTSKDSMLISWKVNNLPSNNSLYFLLVNTNKKTASVPIGEGIKADSGLQTMTINLRSFLRIQSGTYRLKIMDVYGNSDISDGDFIINADYNPPQSLPEIPY